MTYVRAHHYEDAGGQCAGECRHCGHPRENEMIHGLIIKPERVLNQPTQADREGDTQPLPTASNTPIMHRLVQDDLEDRLKIGVHRYGQPLQAFNGRNALRDAYEEVLDLAVYLRQAIFEQENPQ